MLSTPPAAQLAPMSSAVTALRAGPTCLLSTLQSAAPRTYMYHLRLRLRCSQRREVSTATLAEYTGPAGQDLTELFDVYLPPSPESLASRFISSDDLDAHWTGTTTSRAKCHANGIWHRSVHVYGFVDRHLSLLAACKIWLLRSVIPPGHA